MQPESLGTTKDLVLYRIETAKADLHSAEAEEIRHASDYDDFYIAKMDETLEQIATAKELIDVIESYCLDKLKK